MNRGIDHAVVCVRDLERARAFYSSIGFNLTPTALHPFGTTNFLAQLQGNFIEVLGVADASIIDAPEPGRFSFAHHNLRYLSEGEGCSMLVFESRDARSDQAEFRVKQLDTYEPFDFSRIARLPDGEEVTVGFSLAFVTHADMPKTAFFTCQQHAPQHFWKPEYQAHDNAARSISTMTLVADAPQGYETFFKALQGTDAVTRSGDGLEVATARGVIRVQTPEDFERSYGKGTSPALDRGPVFGAMSIATSDLSRAANCLQSSGVEYQSGERSLSIPASDAFGVVIEFVPH